LSWLLLGIGVCIIALSVWLVVHTYTPVLFWDHWEIIKELQDHHSHVTLGELWAQHSEHRILVGRLLYYADLFWFGGRNVSLLIEIVLAQLALLLVFSWTLARFAQLSRSGLFSAIGLVAYCLFSPLQIVNFTWPFQITFVTAALGATVCFAAALTYAAVQSGSRRNLLLAVCLASAAFSEGSVASGLMTWPLLFMMGLLLRFRRRDQIILGISSLLAVSAYFFKYVTPQAHSNPQKSFQYPLLILKFVLTELAWSWDPNIPNHSPWLTLPEALSLVALVASTAFILYYLFFTPVKPIFTFLSIALLYCLLAVVLVALGRLRFGLDQATESRYQSLALLFWAVLYLVTLLKFGQDTRALLAIQVGIVLLILGGATRFDYMIHWAEGRQLGITLGWSELLNNPHDEQAPKALFYDLPTLRSLASYLLQHHWGVRPLPVAVTPLKGSSFLSGYTSADASSCLGFIDGAQSLNNLDELNVEGWAWDKSAAALPFAVLLASSTGAVVGSAQFGTPRPDVRQAIPQITSLGVGWNCTIHDIKPGTYHAFVILHDKKSACELASDLLVGSRSNTAAAPRAPSEPGRHEE
jgi:hypothetical protein